MINSTTAASSSTDRMSTPNTRNGAQLYQPRKTEARRQEQPNIKAERRSTYRVSTVKYFLGNAISKCFNKNGQKATKPQGNANLNQAQATAQQVKKADNLPSRRAVSEQDNGFANMLAPKNSLVEERPYSTAINGEEEYKELDELFANSPSRVRKDSSDSASTESVSSAENEPAKSHLHS
jgi:hypothetical protein